MDSAAPLRVLLYGDFRWDRLAASLRRGFESLGHHVVALDTFDQGRHTSVWMRNRALHRMSLRSLMLRRLGAREWNAYILRMVEQVRPDLLLVIKGDLVMPETLEAVRQTGSQVFLFHPDNPLPPFANHRPESVPCATTADCYWIWSRHLMSRLASLGAERVEYMPFAWDPAVLPYGESGAGDGSAADVVFVGGWDEEREEWLAPLAKQFRLHIWGPPYWGERTRRGSPLRRCWQGTAVHGAAAASVLRNARIALNIIRLQNLPDGTNMRTFELPGCGAFGLSTRTSGALDIFAEDEAGAYFGSPEELVGQIKRFLTDRTARVRIAARAHEIAAQNTYLQRAQRIVDVWHQIADTNSTLPGPGGGRHPGRSNTAA